MKAAIKARWVAALRSGEYKQGKGELRSSDEKYCCLGVLCDLSGADGWSKTEGDEDGLCAFTYVYGDESGFALPPLHLRDPWGFDWAKVKVEIGGYATTLDGHNDAGCTFAQIADAIEAQL